MISYHYARRMILRLPERYEFVMINRDNVKRYVSAAVAMIEGTKKSVVSLFDITRRKVAEEALRRSESRYRGLFETLPYGFASTDIARRIIEINPAFQAMVGFTRKKPAGYAPPQPDTGKVACSTRMRSSGSRFLKKGYSAVYEKEYVRKDGSVFPVEVRTHLIKDQDGNPLELWGFVRHIRIVRRWRRACERARRNSDSFLEVG